MLVPPDSNGTSIMKHYKGKTPLGLAMGIGNRYLITLFCETTEMEGQIILDLPALERQMEAPPAQLAATKLWRQRYDDLIWVMGKQRNSRRRHDWRSAAG